jgi:polyhydroxybutyrate depolymerase
MGRIKMAMRSNRFSAAAMAVGLVVASWAMAARADEVLKIEHQGIERQALLHQPPAIASGPAPLVIALQGLTQTTDSLKEWLQLDAVADREGFRVLYPDAIQHSWSYGRPINQPMPKAGAETADDVGFISRLIDDLVARKLADPARIYVTGISRGALMTYTLACALADRIAAAAALSSSMTEFQRDDCHPARPVPMMVVAGTADPAQSFGGAQGQQGRLLSVPDTMNFWRELHGCAGRGVRALPHRDPADTTRVALVEWSGCHDGRVLLYRVDGGGHKPPSLAPGTAESVARFGARNRDFETADEVWAFFAAVAR